MSTTKPKTRNWRSWDRAKWYHPSRDVPEDKIHVVTPTTATEVIGNLGNDEVAIIDYSRVPYGFREGPEATEKFPKVLNRGPIIQIPTPKSLEAAIKEGIGPTTRRIQTYESLEGNVLAYSMGWYCPNDGKLRKVTAHNVLQGTEAYVAAEEEKTKKHPHQKKVIAVSDYGIDKENRDTGATVIVMVPSASRYHRYRVKLHHFPYIGSDELAIWPWLLTEHSDCDKKNFADVYWRRDQKTGKRKKERDVVFDHHDVTAYFAASKEESGRIRKERPSASRVMTLQPFPLFTQAAVDYWKKLLTQALFGTKDRARPLKHHEIESELQCFLTSTDPRSTMYASRKMRFVDYDWGVSMPVRS